MAFDVSVVLNGSAAEVTLIGDLDASVAPGLLEVLSTAISNKPEHLVLRMQHLDFIASGGIRVLLMAKQRLGSGVSIYVVQPQAQVLETLHRTGVHHAVHIVDTYPLQ